MILNASFKNSNFVYQRLLVLYLQVKVTCQSLQMTILPQTFTINFEALYRLKEVLQKVELVLLILCKPISREYLRAKTSVDRCLLPNPVQKAYTNDNFPDLSPVG